MNYPYIDGLPDSYQPSQIMFNIDKYKKAKQKMLRENMIEKLRESICNVEFTKVNGDTRIMKCTLLAEAIPEDQRPRISAEYSPEVIRAFDINKQEWRSFKVDNVVTFTQYFKE